jgi:predicted amidophosphoribosyltransferase
MKCNFCGADIPPGVLFCPRCGKRVTKSSRTIEINSGSQLFFPSSYEEMSKYTLYLFNLANLHIFDENYEEIGIIKVRNKFLKIIGELYDINDGLILSVSPIFLSFKNAFKIKDSQEKEIARIKKIVFSAMIKNFYIQSPSKEKWFSIIKSRRSNYKIKSFSTNKVVADFGPINQLEEMIIDFSFENPSNIYFLKVNDERVNRLLLLGSFLTIYLNHFI